MSITRDNHNDIQLTLIYVIVNFIMLCVDKETSQICWHVSMITSTLENSKQDVPTQGDKCKCIVYNLHEYLRKKDTFL